MKPKAKEQATNSSRLIYLDFLRIFAVFAIIMIHVAAENWYAVEARSITWNVYNAFDSIARWGVPIFVMISGTLFLTKEKPLSEIFKKNILKIIIIFFFWSLIYSFWGIFKGDITNATDFFITFFKGPGHFWFLFMIIGMYLISPLLKKIISDPKSMKYFLALSFFFAFLIPEIIEFTKIFAPPVASTLQYINDKTNISFVLGFSGYYIAGYYLAHTKLSKKCELIIYILGIVGAIATIIISAMASYYINKPTSVFYENMTVNVLAMSLALFTFAKQHLNRDFKQKTKNIIILLSKCTLGIYIIHLLILFMLDHFLDLNTASFNPLFSVPIISSIIFVISLIITIILRHAPIVKKWLV